MKHQLIDLPCFYLNKYIHTDAWNDDNHGSLENELRTDCLEQGVHPVWHEMAKRCDLFGQFSACPISEAEAKSSQKKFDLSKTAIDIQYEILC